MIIGGCAVDITCTVFSNKQHNTLTRSSYPGQLQRTLGGVGCNIARVAHQCGIGTSLVSITGDDADGYWIRKTLNDMDISCQQIQQTSEGNTAVYNAIHEADGQLYVAVADMNIFDQMRPDLLVESINVTRPAFVCFDGNIPVKCMQVISESCAKLNIPVLFEPTSVPKSLRILQDPAILACGGIQYITPNHHELEAMIKFMERTDLLTTKSNEKDELLLLRDIPITWHTVAKSAIYLSNSIPNVIVKLGEHGVLCVHRIATTNIKLKHYPSLKASM
ncbi:Ribokinase-like protein [Syncephalis plumigaleata]|nr:Ribokinase-like protein [Syncephalis plumigaleata]